MKTTPEEAAAHREAMDWNSKNPSGTPVLAWPGTRDQEPLRTRTRDSAWPMGGHTAVQRVDGYAGGIALTHLEVDPTRQPAVPDLDFSCPPCAFCCNETSHSGDGFSCEECGASWGEDGRHGGWDDPDANRCPAVRSYDELPDDHCVLAAGHDGSVHHPADGIGEWTDSDERAVIDSDGEQVSR